jgi:hypothetical protein
MDTERTARQKITLFQEEYKQFTLWDKQTLAEGFVRYNCSPNIIGELIKDGDTLLTYLEENHLARAIMWLNHERSVKEQECVLLDVFEKI